MACEDSHGGQEYSGCREVLFLVSEGPTQNLTDWQETSSAWNFDHLTNNGDTATSTLESTSVAPERDDADAKGAQAAIQLLGLPLPELSFFPDRPLSHSLPSTLNQAWRLRHNSSSVSDDDSLQPRQLHGSWPQHELLRAKSATAQLAAPAPSSIPPATPFAQLPAASSSGFPQPRPGFSQPLSHPITEQFKEMVSHMRPQPLDELLPAIPLFSGQQLQLQQQGRAASGLSAEQAASWHESAADWMTASHLSLPGSFLPAASLPSSHTALGLPFTHPSTHSLRSASNRAGPLLEPPATAERENSSSKRVHREELEEEEGMLERSGGRGSKRPRLVWTQELHTRFLNAVNHLGLKDAVPKTILQLMNVEGMTRENVASHLQKYRLHLKRATGLPPGAQLPPDTLQYLGRAAPSAGPAAEPAQASGTLPAAAFASMRAAAPAFPEAMPKNAVTTISSFSHVPLPLAWMAHEQQTWQPPVGMPPFGSHMQPSLVNPSTQAAAAFGGASLPAPNLLQHAIPMMAGPKGVPQWVWGSPAHLSTNPENGAPPSLNGAPPMGQSLAGEQDEAAGASRIPFVGPDFSREKHGELMTDTGPAAGAQHSSSLGEAAASSCSSPGD